MLQSNGRLESKTYNIRHVCPINWTNVSNESNHHTRRKLYTVAVCHNPLGAIGVEVSLPFFLLQTNHVGELAVASQQLVGRALFAHRSATKHHDVVGIADGAHTVGDDDNSLVAHQFGDARLYFRLVLGVKACGGFVEKYDWGILQQGAGNGNALPLAT